MTTALTGASGAGADRDPSRVHWMELFFDLIFVALIGQLAGALHEESSFAALALFIALFASVWWSWVNLTFTVNVLSWLTRRQLALVMLAAMFAVGAIAVAAPEATGELSWLFAAGNAALRFLLLGLWATLSWNTGVASRLRLLAYNGVTGVLWLASIWVPAPVKFLLWGVALVTEVVLLLTNSRSWPERMLPRMNVEHLSERFGLLVVIVLGESVLTIVTALNGHWSVATGVTAALCLVVVAVLAWAFFMYGAEMMREGLEHLQKAGLYRPIRDTVGFLPFFLVVGVTALSGALAASIHHPLEPLPPAGAVSLCGGIVLFYVTNAIVSLRFGRPLAQVLRWAVPALLLLAVPAVMSASAPAMVTIASTAGALLIIALLAELGDRRARRSS